MIPAEPPLFTRRRVLGGAALLGAAALLPSACSSSHHAPAPTTTTTTRQLRPGERPRTDLPEGHDTLPEVDHIVILMMENHSFDDHLGTLGRGDGFKIGRDGMPTNTNPDGQGHLIRSFPMPSDCQMNNLPGQDWNRSHTSWDGGAMDGFVKASGPVAMGYWTRDDLPYYHWLASTFPLCDRWFCSTLAQTFPNRRYLIAGTSAGLVDNNLASINDPVPAGGTIFQALSRNGITWRNYFSTLPTVALFAKALDAPAKANLVNVDQFFTDAAAGSLPSVSLVDPDFENTSEENPQDIAKGEAFAAKVINAVITGPAWPKTLLVWNYDEHGGYYDHVPPPPAVAPDDIAPKLPPTMTAPGGFDRYGIRVPAVVVSPYAKRAYVSHTVHDHTSILKLIETKWNLPALTRRDAGAADLLDTVDFTAAPAFLHPPAAPEPAAASGGAVCTPGDPGGPIPPASAVLPA